MTEMGRSQWRAGYTWACLGFVALLIALAIAWREIIPVRVTILCVVIAACVVVGFVGGFVALYRFWRMCQLDTIEIRRLQIERDHVYGLEGTIITRREGGHIMYRLDGTGEEIPKYSLDATVGRETKVHIPPSKSKASITIPELLEKLWGEGP